MMYFDIHYIRKFLSYTINILLASGIAILIFGIILTFIVNMEDDSNYQAVRIVNGLRYINHSVFACGLALILCGLIGYLTTKVNNDITVGLFALISFIIFIAILIFTMGFIGLVYVNQIAQSQQHACIKTDFFALADRVYQKASRYYGSSKCMTNIKNTYPFSRNPDFVQLGIQNDIVNGYSSVFNCPHYSDMIQDLRLDEFDDTPSYIGSLEITFQCGGVCQAYPLYVFTDVNRGPPVYQKGCYQAVVEYVDKISIPGVVVLWLITCLLLLVVINSLCLFFHPKRYDDLYIYQSVNQTDREDEKQGDSSYDNDLNFSNQHHNSTQKSFPEIPATANEQGREEEAKDDQDGQKNILSKKIN